MNDEVFDHHVGNDPFYDTRWWGFRVKNIQAINIANSTADHIRDVHIFW